MTVCGLCIIDEEISNMRRELDKYGIQMPAFSKIGGMLANEVVLLCCEAKYVRRSVLCDMLSTDPFPHSQSCVVHKHPACKSEFQLVLESPGVFLVIFMALESP